VDLILVGESFDIESEDHILLRRLYLGSEYGQLLRHIEIGFLSVCNFAALAE
jgi:hypothetical protein